MTHDRTTDPAPARNALRAVECWLYACCAMVFAMVVIGAVTRLTESGLSITEWKPVTGALPPLSAAAWDHEFALYQQSPEFIHKHNWMTLADFKKIYFWEWLHRLWGRLIGVVYAVPLVWFVIRRQVPRGYGWKFLALLVLGGLQGFMGWWMVASGLIDRPHVSHYRLAAHLGLAFVIFAGLWALALQIRTLRLPGWQSPVPQGAGGMLHGILGLAVLFVTIIWGAFVAGLDAGMIYNTFPMMDNDWLPAGTFTAAHLFEDHGWVQFSHRILAFATTFILLAYAVRTRRIDIAVMVCVQVALGIGTLLTQVALPLAALHQAGALILLALVVSTLTAPRTG